MRIRNPGLQYYVRFIEAGEPCSFVRFGDGEWTAGILHDRPRTTSRSQSLDILGLQRDMRRAFTECHLADNYFPSLRPTSLKPRITNFLKKNVPQGVIFHDCRVFYLSSAHGELFLLVEALRNLKIPLVFVGPPRHHLLRMSGVFPERSSSSLLGRIVTLTRSGSNSRLLSWTIPPLFRSRQVRRRRL